jgi:hypothetical protein
MAESEQSYADRTQKSQNLHDACNGLSPAYAAPAGGVTLAAFQGKIDACDELIADVDNATANWRDAVNRRSDVANEIRGTVTNLLAYIKTVPGWKAQYPQAKIFSDAIRGVKTPRKTVTDPQPDEPPARTHQRGGQSYAEIEKSFRGLVNLSLGLGGFAPANAAISAAAISALLSSVTALNEEVSMKESALRETQQLRQAAFYDEDGLAGMFRDVKLNVKGQYGVGSTQWGQVKGMKW